MPKPSQSVIAQKLFHSCNFTNRLIIHTIFQCLFSTIPFQLFAAFLHLFSSFNITKQGISCTTFILLALSPSVLLYLCKINYGWLSCPKKVKQRLILQSIRTSLDKKLNQLRHLHVVRTSILIFGKMFPFFFNVSVAF